MPTETKITNLVINSVDSYETYKKMIEQSLINENELYLVDGDDSQEKITVDGILKGDGTGTITAAETTDAEIVEIPLGVLKGTLDGLETAVIGTDYASPVHTHTPTDIADTTVVETPLGILKGTLNGLDTAIIGTDFASPVHTHSAADITDGTLAVARGGTGATAVGGIAYGTLGFRGTKLANTDTSPGTNNTICWTYE